MTAAAVLATLLALHNGARAARHEAPLRTDPVLVHAAQVKAGEIARCGFAHDACGHPWFAVLPQRAWVGENIAEGYTTARAVYAGWMASQGHRENILRPQFRRVGFAHLGRFWVAEFST